MINDLKLREEIAHYCKGYNYTDGQIKLILRLMQEDRVKVNESGPDFSGELLDVLDQFEKQIGEPPEIEPAYKGETESERAERTPRTFIPGAPSRMNGATASRSSGPSFDRGRERALKRERRP